MIQQVGVPDDAIIRCDVMDPASAGHNKEENIVVFW